MADRELDRLWDLMNEASSAGLIKKAARIARQGAELATRRREHYWRVRFRAWEGSYLRAIGEREAVMPPLLEACRHEPEADPADVFLAITELIAVAIRDQPASRARQLIAQGREHLERSGKTAWRHRLDSLEGYLESWRGDWPAALDSFRVGYEHRCRDTQGSGFSVAAHLSYLAIASFGMHDRQALDRWRRALDECDKKTEEDRLDAEQARLLCHRANLPDLGDPIACARALLRRLEGYEGERDRYARDALRVLILHRHWPPVDDWLPRPGIGDHWLFGGDVHLARARESLALPPRDEDWHTDRERPDPGRLTPPQGAEARTHLQAARAHFESKLDWAAREDARLETDYYTRTLKTRLQRTADLEPLA